MVSLLAVITQACSAEVPTRDDAATKGFPLLPFVVHAIVGILSGVSTYGFVSSGLERQRLDKMKTMLSGRMADLAEDEVRPYLEALTVFLYLQRSGLMQHVPRNSFQWRVNNALEREDLSELIEVLGSGYADARAAGYRVEFIFPTAGRESLGGGAPILNEVGSTRLLASFARDSAAEECEDISDELCQEVYDSDLGRREPWVVSRYSARDACGFFLRSFDPEPEVAYPPGLNPAQQLIYQCWWFRHHLDCDGIALLVESQARCLAGRTLAAKYCGDKYSSSHEALVFADRYYVHLHCSNMLRNCDNASPWSPDAAQVDMETAVSREMSDTFCAPTEE